MKVFVIAMAFYGAAALGVWAEAAPDAAKDSGNEGMLSMSVDSFLTPENVAKLEKGEVVMVKSATKDAQGHSLGQGRAAILVKRPFADVWDQMIRYEQHPEFLPHLVSNVKYSEQGGEVGLEKKVRVMLKTITYHTLNTRDRDKGVIAWRLDKTKTNDIKDTHGNWTFRAHGETACIVVITTMVESGMHIPKVMESFSLNQDLPGIVKAVKKRVESKEGK
jgi:ribosome-associated toxin RatA of RatAB toxin-antitoxin module